MARVWCGDGVEGSMRGRRRRREVTGPEREKWPTWGDEGGGGERREGGGDKDRIGIWRDVWIGELNCVCV